MSLGKARRRWLRRAGLASSEHAPPDHLPELPSIERLRLLARGGDRDTSPAEFASVMLAVTRDGDADMRAALVDAWGTAPARWLRTVDEALRTRWWEVPRFSDGP